ncbi:hypothetical protein PY834_001361 [Salmonella enterica]|uniref:Uncharacterized protein n=1 Tax=Salmonella enterica TaxID=28901 RepID=A0A5V0SW01_SALER|nr:hypothetical protein [Salmonella enterica]EBS4769310.1 hypothetical protein [Salmonella enterica subsp. enterica serovar Sandiego]ECB0373069.1 hypothetical protein [Salmonella enterica subsp. enterica serovar Muenchen]ECU4586550.1 hypothetical protein [Salmonella enterica subsp. enterica]ECU9089575.1 hypothetical protein [Salmonella enterica subsp. enterica serovar Cotham]EDQ5101714.1 hypothetical protein [Salmonella enterica subsp. enterica serovar Saintpaul]EDV8333552.1 hypothetical prot
MSLLCKRCDNPVDELDFEKATIMESFDGTWCIDLIVKCPHCGLPYNAFVPTSELQPLTGDDNDK